MSSNASSISAGVVAAARTAWADGNPSSSITRVVAAAAARSACHAGFHAVTTFSSAHVASPSFSQRSSHQRMVTRLPSHWCEISCATRSAVSRLAATVASESISSPASFAKIAPVFSIAPPNAPGMATRSSFWNGYFTAKYLLKKPSECCAASSANRPCSCLPGSAQTRTGMLSVVAEMHWKLPTASATR